MANTDTNSKDFESLCALLASNGITLVWDAKINGYIVKYAD